MESETRHSTKEAIELKVFNGHNIVTFFHDASAKDLVIFCHGFKGTSIGPHRSFVEAARQLADAGISSLRFDQYGSGNSAGDFIDSSFIDWVETTNAIREAYLADGFRVALFGQSMGASTAIVVASEAHLAGVVAWVPDPNVDEFVPSPNGSAEEGGQLVQDSFWREAKEANVAQCLRSISCPAYIVQCTDDIYVNEDNRRAIRENANPQHIVETFDGYSHSAWSYLQTQEIVHKSVNFLENAFRSR